MLLFFRKMLLTGIFFIAFQVVYCQNSFNGIQIGHWKDFKKSALSITFDDGYDVQFYGAMPILDSLGLKSTMYLICNDSRDSGTWNYLNNEAKKGHEIGSHTVNHVVLTSVSNDVIDYELSESKRRIEKLIPDQKSPITFCYPGGALNLNVREIVSKYYIAARSVRNHFNEDTTDIYQLRTQWVLSKTKYSALKSYLNYSLNYPNWTIEMYHGFDNEGWEPIPLSLFRAHMIDLSKDTDKIWVAPVRDVILYKRQRERAHIVVLSKSMNEVSFCIRDTLDNNIYDFPLSLRVLVPVEWTNMSIKQGSKDMEYLLKYESNNNFVYFDALPNNGIITIHNNSGSAENSFNSFFYSYPVPFSERLNIDMISPYTGKLKVLIHDILGKMVHTEFYEVNSGMNTIIIDTSTYKTELFFISAILERDNYVIINRLKVLKQ